LPIQFISLFAVAALATYFLLRTLEPLAHRWGLVDHPGGRKDHAHPTPIIGGLAMAVAIVLTVVAFGHYTEAFVAFAVGSALLIVMGLIDDARDLRWWIRILAQVAAALIMSYWGGVRVESLGPLFSSTPISLGLWSEPVTVFLTVGMINAINMCDGADGLAGSLCLAAMLMLAAAALYAGNALMFERLLPVVAAIGVFLLFNMRHPWQHRAKVFMGNAGSAFLGYLIIWVVFRLTQNEAHPVSPLLMPWLIALPLIDCVTLMVRRFLQGGSPFRADRGHLHHLLLDAGFNPTQIALGLSAVSLALGLAAALALKTGLVEQTTLVLTFVLLTLGYFWLSWERTRAVRAFSALREWLPRNPFRSLSVESELAAEGQAQVGPE
jgi:UDP-GlcNAc:undecaprenyl-phosphate GlcNAc-1-phosphate transferase